MPRRSSNAASPSAWARSSANDHVRSAPSSPSQTIAVRSGSDAAHLSTQLWARFTVPPVNHLAHAMPSEASSTCEYGENHSRSRKRTTASQNHSGSSIDRRTSSSKSVMPCAAMNRPTLVAPPPPQEVAGAQTGALTGRAPLRSANSSETLRSRAVCPMQPMRHALPANGPTPAPTSMP